MWLFQRKGGDDAEDGDEDEFRLPQALEKVLQFMDVHAQEAGVKEDVDKEQGNTRYITWATIHIAHVCARPLSLCQSFLFSPESLEKNYSRLSL